MAQALRKVALLSALLPSVPVVNAQMEMSWPYSFRSKFNPNSTDPDYDNHGPLIADGSNYPCKGYQDLPSSQNAVVSYVTGQTYNLTLAGSARRSGGSCQISLSYDNGQSFHVIKSMIGGCPLKDDWDFTIPSYAPPTDSAILAWTWFNLIGNREMYMQCARVAITGQAVQRYRRTSSRRQSSVNQLPGIFACNIDNGCTTIEDHEVVFPNPGTVTEKGTDLYSALPGLGYTLAAKAASYNFVAALTVGSIVPIYTPGPYSNGSTTTNSTGSFETGTGIPTFTGHFNASSLLTMTSGPTTTPLISYSTITITTVLPTTIYSNYTIAANMTVVTLTTIIPVSTIAATPTTSYTTLIGTPTTSTTISTTTTSPSATLVPGLCTPGQFTCNSLTSFSQCVGNADGSTSYVYMGNVAAGMRCVNGVIIRQNDGVCTPDGALQCNGSQSFYICTNGGLINMGPLAPGTVCVDGAIVAA